MQEFQIQTGKHQIRIVFSEDAASPTVEDALVKILSNEQS